MYKKNKMLSAVAAVAVLSSGAMSFDMRVKDNNKELATILSGATDSNDANKANSNVYMKSSSVVPATYTDTSVFVYDKNGTKISTPIITAEHNMTLSKNDRGDALIYPAFRASDGWETKITVRNTRDVSVIAKAVLYDAYDSHELKDFNLYLSSHDVASFKIKAGDGSDTAIVTTQDGSIMAGIDPTFETSQAEPVKHEDAANTNIPDKIIDKDGDFVIATTEPFSDQKKSGYVIVYVMAQTDVNKSATGEKRDYYHKDHKKLYRAYYNALTKCRGENWKKIFGVYGTAKNGTATELDVTAPDVNESCDDYNNSKDDVTYFKAPDGDILFGEVSIYKGGSDPRSLLLKATAIENYTDGTQMMLWAPGEYASIQDRRIVKDQDGDGYADYNTTGIANDAKDMVVTHGYYSFNKKRTKNDRWSLLVTQPMKRALVMAGHGGDYWSGVKKYSNWGQFSLGMKFYDENENDRPDAVKLVTVTSPANAKDAKLYEPEMAPLDYDTLAAGATKYFRENATTGYADIKINGNKGLPAIITEMVSEDVNGEAQINWIYSATNK